MINFKLNLNLEYDTASDPQDLEAVIASLVSKRDVIEPLLLAIEQSTSAVVVSVTLDDRFTSLEAITPSFSPAAIRKRMEGNTRVHDPLDPDSPSYQELANSLTDTDLFIAAINLFMLDQVRSTIEDLTIAIIDEAYHYHLTEGDG